MHKQLAELKRAGKRQAAPFSKGERSSSPKRPGRKPGMGSFSYRKSPSPDEVTEPLVEVAVAEDTCPGCGGRLEHEGVRVVYATDIPPVPRPQVTGYRVQICRCRSCGKQVRGRHPDVAPDQYGASAHRVGRRVMAAAHVLHYGVGVPVRKVPAVLRALTGVELSQGAISQDALRRARGAVGDAYHKLRGSVRASPLVHTDDTGWRVDGGPAFPMAFETDEATVYQVRARHRNEEVREVVPSDYGGVMVTDRGRSYDAQALSGVKQQKCLARVLRSISEVVQTKRGRGRSFGNRLSRLLREAMELRQAYHRGEAADFAAEAERLRREATYHLRDRPMSDADNWRLQDELGWHHDRGNLLRFLDDPRMQCPMRLPRAPRKEPMSLSQRLFAASYDLLNWGVEGRLREYRQRTAGMARGDVLEIGGGTGANLPFYRDDVRLTVVEPNPHMAKRLLRKAARLNRRLTVVAEVGEEMSFPDASFDSVVTTLVLCTVDDLQRVVREARRVLRPGGALYFYEHVASEGRRRRRWEDRLNPVWRYITTGCNLNRDAASAIRAAGFSEVDLTAFDLSVGLPLTLPNIVGVARV